MVVALSLLPQLVDLSRGLSYGGLQMADKTITTPDISSDMNKIRQALSHAPLTVQKEAIEALIRVDRALSAARAAGIMEEEK